MTRRKFILMLVIVNVVIITVFTASVFLVNDFLKSSASSRVNGVRTSEPGQFDYNSIAVDINPGAEDVYFAMGKGGEVKILRYRSTTEPQEVFSYKKINPLVPVGKQLLKIQNPKAQEEFIYINAGIGGDEIVSRTIDSSVKKLYTSNKSITSIGVNNKTIYFLVFDIDAESYNLFSLDMLSHSSSKLTEFNSANPYWLDVATGYVNIVDSAMTNCFQYLYPGDEIVDIDCLKINDETVETSFDLARTTAHNENEEDDDSEDEAEKSDEEDNEPVSFPEIDKDFFESVFWRDEVKDAGFVTKKGLSNPEPIFTGVQGEDLEMVYEDSDVNNDENYLYLLSNNLNTETKSLIKLQIPEKSEQEARAVLINKQELPHDFTFLGSNKVRGEIYFDFYHELASGKLSNLNSYLLKTDKLLEYSLPECVLITNGCSIDYIN